MTVFDAVVSNRRLHPEGFTQTDFHKKSIRLPLFTNSRAAGWRPDINRMAGVILNECGSLRGIFNAAMAMANLETGRVFESINRHNLSDAFCVVSARQKFTR